jgi:hypothetical protein
MIKPTPVPPPVLSDRQSAQGFAEQVHGLLVALTSHLARETEALRRGAYASGVSDPDTKAELVFAYRDALQTLQANAAVLSRFVPVKLDELRRLNASFQAELQINLAAVSTARAVSEQLLNRLADQVTSARRPKTYGANGAMTRPPGAAALAVDKAL